MEFASGRSGSGGGGEVKEEKRSDYSVNDDELRHNKQESIVQEPPMTNAERSMQEAKPKECSVKKNKVDYQLETAKAEMGEVKEENERLKMSLNKIMEEYRTLQMQFHERKMSTDKENNLSHEEIIEESDMVSLSLGRVPRNHEEKVIKVTKPILKDEEEFNQDLALGLECKYETSKSGSTTNVANFPNTTSPTNSSEVQKEEAGKILKTVRDVEHDEVSQQTPAKKARVCVRARCETPTMNDGCQWRKYGQKISKGNPCPRAYYRCTISPSCPVRKQVQRCVEDMSILITTYEGTHNHSLPLSATAMASTTSAAASMLLSGSSTSHSSSIPFTSTTSTMNNHANSNNLHGLKFYLSDGSKPKQLYLSSPALTSSPSHPTITLDLTSNPSLSSSPFVRFNTSNYNQPRYPSSTTSLNFSSTESNNNNNAIMSWSNNGFLNYGSTQPYNSNKNNNNILSTVNFARQQQQQQPIENFYQPFMQNSNTFLPQGVITSTIHNQHGLPDTIAAATKAITADPTFQTALAAALSSFIGSSGANGSTQGNINEGIGEKLSQKIKWAEMFPASSTSLANSASKTNGGCASNFLNKTSTNT
ncbi:hypothetical protein TanjilG_18427 [Lupinus angustifolius]|uniref:WRKY domain-containing protein n=1 Tax=Lupinus angustifolius TaxID=3871 RepID=A0A4P1RW55_LUPAN|nr:PREDICTED: probable WRKY transcription factor 61 [Lupinus angustifolius]OIW19617.1 hypothetical protein TanjilG_18427 [Lupinus angustifolius]